MIMRKSLALAIAIVGVSEVAHDVPAYAQSPSWSGPYAGVGGGGAWGQQSQSGGILILPGGGSSTTAVSTTIFDGNYNISGGLVGGAVGYNFQSGRAVYGIEADASWADVGGSGTCGFGGAVPHACGGDIRGLETVRGRLGYDLGPVASFGGMLAFVSGGLAVGQVHAWDSLFGTSGDKSAAGWTIGGGLEAMLGTNWSIKLEYLHVDLGNPAVFSAAPPVPEHVSTTAEVVRVGLDYHFSWTVPATSSPPILTKR
jgi:opacity protein-like surface antigen